MISKEVFEVLTEEVLDLYEKTRAEKLSFNEFYKEMEKLRKKHNISKGEMADYIGFMNAHFTGDLDA